MGREEDSRKGDKQHSSSSSSPTCERPNETHTHRQVGRHTLNPHPSTHTDSVY